MQQHYEHQQTLEILQNGATELDLSDHVLSEQDIISLTQVLANNQTLKRLDLSNIIISEESAKALAHLLTTNSTLTDLLVCNCQINDPVLKILTNALSQNQTLEILDLSENRIGGEGALALAETHFSTLKELYLNTNLIDDRGALALAKTLESNKKLKYLSLHENTFGMESTSALINTLNLNETLTDLSLDKDKIREDLFETFDNLILRNQTFDQTNESTIEVLRKTLEPVREGNSRLLLMHKVLNEETVSDVCSVIATSTTLRAFSLFNVPFTNFAIKALSKAIATNKSLTSVQLITGFSPEVGSELLKAIASNQGIESVSIQYDRWLDDFMEPLCETIKNSRSLKILDLQECSLSDSPCRLLVQSLETNRSLECLTLDKVPISPANIRLLSNALNRNQAITFLELRNVIRQTEPPDLAIQNEATQALGDLLKANPHLRVVDVQHNHIQDDAAITIAQGLTLGSDLIELNLEFNEIGDVGATELAHAFSSHKNLKKMKLSYNEIGNAGAVALVRATIARGLDQLDLNTNRIDDQGIKTIAQILAKDSTLRNLDLSWNPITDNGISALIQALTTNITIQYLHLEPSRIIQAGGHGHENIQFNPELMNELESLLQRNRDYNVAMITIYSAYEMIKKNDFDDTKLNEISDFLDKAEKIVKKHAALDSAYSSDLQSHFNLAKGMFLVRTGKILQCLDFYISLQPQAPAELSLEIAMMIQGDQPFEDKQKNAALILMLLRGVPDGTTLQFFAFQDLCEGKVFSSSQSLAEILEVDKVLTLIDSKSTIAESSAYPNKLETCIFYEDLALNPRTPTVHKVPEGKTPPSGNLRSQFEEKKLELLQSLKSAYSEKSTIQRNIQQLQIPMTLPFSEDTDNTIVIEELTAALEDFKQNLHEIISKNDDKTTLDSINTILLATRKLINNLQPDSAKDILKEFRNLFRTAQQGGEQFFQQQPPRSEQIAALSFADSIEHTLSKIIYKPSQ